MANGTDRAKSYELVDYWVVLRRRWVWVVAGLIIGALLAGTYLHVASKSYTSSAGVLVTPTGVDTSSSASVAGGRTKTDVNLDTEAQLVQSSVVASGARTLLHTTTPADQLAGNVAVTVPPNSSVLSIAYKSPNAKEAQRGALAFAQAYLANRTSTAKASVASQVASLKGQIKGLDTQLQQVTGRIATQPTNSPDRALAQAQQNTISTQISALSTNLTALTTTPVTPGSIISQPKLPGSPTSPKASYSLVGGLLAGLLLGLIMAVIREKTDHRVAGATDLERRLDLAVLAELPRTRRRRAEGLAGTATPTGAAFRKLANQVQAALGGTHRALLVAPVVRGTGAAIVAPNLAAALARGGSNVILLCADPTSASTTRVLDVAGSEGLADILYDHRTIEDVVTHLTHLPRLLVVGPGLRPELAEEGVQNEKVSSLLSALRATADYVIVEAPPTSKSADAQTLAALVDATVLSVEPKATSYAQVLDAVHQLDGVGSEILGSVVVPAIRWTPAPKESLSRHAVGHNGTGVQRHETLSSAEAERTVPANDPTAIATSPTPES